MCCLVVSLSHVIKPKISYPPLIHRLSTRCYSAEIAEHITANRGARVLGEYAEGGTNHEILGKYAEGGTNIKKNYENYECIEKA